MATEGRVVSVKEHQAGSELSADVIAGATTLVPVDIEEFNLDGGQLTIGTEQEPITYTVDENSDELTLATALANAYSEDEPVLLYPSTVERWCNFVEPNGENTLEARVPHALTPLLPLGIRNPDDATAEIVQADYVGTDLVLTDVLGKEPLIEAKVRSPGFVSEEFEQAVLALEPSLYWRLGKNGLKDLSGNKRDGSAVGGVTVGGGDGLLADDDDASTDFNDVDQGVSSLYSPFINSAVHCFGGLGQADTAIFAPFQSCILSGDDDGLEEIPTFYFGSTDGLPSINWTTDRLNGSAAGWVNAWPSPTVGEPPITYFWFLRIDPVNDTAELYIDGLSKGVRSAIGPYSGAPGNVQLGAGDIASMGTFDGRLDEFMIFEHDVSAAQIAELYRVANRFPADAPAGGVVGYSVPEGETKHIKEGEYLIHTGNFVNDGSVILDGTTLEVTEA